MPLARALVLVLLSGLTTQAREPGPPPLDPAVAEQALGHAREGTLLLEWDSQGEAAPVLVVVLAAAVIELEGDRAAELHLERAAVARARPAKDGPGGWKWKPEAGKERTAGPVDLARLYAPSREVPGMFVNLARLLRQPCQPRWPALDVPDLDREQADARAAELTASAAQERQAEGAEEVTGLLVEEGKRLLLQREGRTWELVPGAGREAALALLRGRAGCTVTAHLVPQDEGRGPRRRAALQRVSKVVRPRAEEGAEDRPESYGIR